MPGMLYSYSTPAPMSKAPLSSAKNNQSTRSVTIVTQKVNIIDPMRKGVLMTIQLNLKKSEKRYTTMIVRAESEGSYSSVGGADFCFVVSLERLELAAISETGRSFFVKLVGSISTLEKDG